MDLFKKVFTEDLIKKLFAIFLLIILFYFINTMLTLVLLTFVFSFLFYKSISFIYRSIHKIFPIKKKAMTILIYILMLFGICFLLYNCIPAVIKQLFFIRRQLIEFNVNSYKNILGSRVMWLIKQSNINTYLSKSGGLILKWVLKMEQLSVNILFSFVLSLVFILEQEQIVTFARKIEKSKIAYFYNYYKYLGKKFLNSFGKIMEVQAILSLINSVLASIGLLFLGFDDVLGLGVMLFILGLIPIAGLIIALVPFIIIAFSLGGIPKVIDVLVIFGVLHLLENYIIKPKLMSISVHLPIFFVFLILIFSQHYMGIWGLIIGIPLFVFLLDILQISES
ncbi:AI-2E family transporter [Clostridium sp. WILCCON 0269]|uniref:AI-2E family transporter n=1 Tax=Candidatus Clostridium eludens TaxID=3381663 RepID=A0ABW8SHX9_9CLOT